MSPALSDNPKMRDTKNNLEEIQQDDTTERALLENAKDKLRLATIERKRMTSLNAESRGCANRQSRHKDIDN